MNNKILLVLALFFSFFIFSCSSVDDPSGIYAGVIPAADCPGISVVAILNSNGTYKVTYQYIDRGDSLFTYTGAYKWDAASKMITLDARDLPSYYRPGKNSLTQLDLDGKEIKGKTAAMYILRKI